jgi:hypothetical protein
MRLATALILIALVLAAPAFAADVTGKWKATLADMGMEMTFTFKAEGSTLTGMVSGQMGEMQITDGKVDGNNITFTVTIDQGKVVHKGVLNGDDMKITAQMGDQNFEMTAKRM